MREGNGAKIYKKKSQNQFGFIPRKSIVDAIFLLKQLLKISRKKKRSSFNLY